MHIVSHGIDIVEVPRIAEMAAEHGERFLDRVFTQRERAYCDAGKRRDEHLAARFAAKEAVLKALGTGWSTGIAWTDVEVTREPSGRPGIALRGRALAAAEKLGVASWSLSLSHTPMYAVASALGMSLAD